MADEGRTSTPTPNASPEAAAQPVLRLDLKANQIAASAEHPAGRSLMSCSAKKFITGTQANIEAAAAAAHRVS